jgi:hypothetical protein
VASHFRLSLETTEPAAPLIALLRRHTGKTISELCEAVAAGRPFLDEAPHHNRYSEFIARVTELLDELDARGIGWGVEVDGARESPQYLRNVFARWHEIGRQLREYDDRVAGEGP